MNTFEEYVFSERKRRLKENVVIFRKEIRTAASQTKIMNWANLHGYTVEETEMEILKNDMFAANFAKDPIKQNFTEKIAEDILGVKKEPNRGWSFTSDGSLVKGANICNSKTIDFIKDDIYITQKYTNGSGGAQDNQFRDVITFLSYGSKQHRVAAYLDGSYYTSKKTAQLKELFGNNPNVIITSLQEVWNENRYTENPALHNQL